MKRYIRSSTESYQLYRNKYNESKYIETRKTSDGHTWYRSFSYWNTDRGPVKNYYTSKSNKGRWHRGTQESLKKILEDYEIVESVEDGVEDSFDYADSPENPNDIIQSSVDVSDYDQLSSTIYDAGDTYALFRKKCDGKMCWAAAKYVNGSPDTENAFEISYDQARGFEPLSKAGELGRKLGKALFQKKQGEVLGSRIGDYKGYEIGLEDSPDQRYYFVDDHGKLHYAELEEELKAKIDKYISKKPVRASVNLKSILPSDLPVEKWYSVLRTSGKDIDETLKILVDNGWKVDKWTHLGSEILRKDGNTIKVWHGESPRFCMIDLIDDKIESCDMIQSSIELDNLNKGDIVVVNNESKLSNKLDLVPVSFDHYSADDDRTFWGWAWNEHLFRYYKSTIVYTAKDMNDAEDFIKKNKKKSVEDFKKIISSEDISLHNLDDQLILFLEDLVFTHHVLEDLDFSYLQVTNEEEKKLFKYMNQYMAAEDDGDKTRSEYIANRVKDLIVSINSVVEASQSVSGWYVGDPDPSGRLEGDARFESRIHSWRDAYQEFNKIADKYFPDAEKIDEEIAKLYFRFKHNPFFQQAWMRWRDSGEDDIYGSSQNLSPFIVYYSYDVGDVENGPIVHGGDDLIYAEDVDDAVDKWCSSFVDPGDTQFCGVWAEPADEEYIQQYNAENHRNN